jgi:hypothetical protein
VLQVRGLVQISVDELGVGRQLASGLQGFVQRGLACAVGASQQVKDWAGQGASTS